MPSQNFCTYLISNLYLLPYTTIHYLFPFGNLYYLYGVPSIALPFSYTHPTLILGSIELFSILLYKLYNTHFLLTKIVIDTTITTSLDLKVDIFIIIKLLILQSSFIENDNLADYIIWHISQDFLYKK